MHLNKSQQLAFDKITQYSKGVFLINGPAGSGKTFLASEIIKHFISHGKTVLGLSPTHQAAAQLRNNLTEYMDVGIRVNTVASYLQVKKEINPISGKPQFVEGKGGGKDKIKFYNVIIVDESSMINEYQVKKIFLSSPRSLIIFFGDYNQLQPVSGNSSINFFKNEDIITLDEIERFDGDILQYCNQLRDTMCYPPQNSSEISIISGLDNAYQNIYNHIINNDSNPDSICYLGFTNNSVKYMRNKLQLALYGNYDFYKDQYIKLETPTEHGFNGDINRILDVKTKQILLFDNMIFDAYVLTIQNIHTGFIEEITTVNYEDREYIEDILKNLYTLAEQRYAEFNSIPNKKSYNYKVQKYMWVDVLDMVKSTYNLALVTCPYSSTIHKSQGRTIENVYANITNINTYGRTIKKNLMYVAASRTSKKLYVVKEI